MSAGEKEGIHQDIKKLLDEVVTVVARIMEMAVEKCYGWRGG